MNKQIFIKNSFILVLTSFLINAMGFGFRIILSNRIGTVGVGLLSLVLNVYMFFATFATSGITLAVTRLVTDNDALKRFSVSRYVVKCAVIFALILTSALGIVLFFGAQYISNNILGTPYGVLPLKILSFSLPLMAVSACNRGYFYAKRNTLATAGEQLLEQSVEMITFLIVLGLIKSDSVEYGCCAVVAGTTAAEFISFFYSYFLYRRDVKKYSGEILKDRGELTKIFKISIPVTGSACLRSGLIMLENILIPMGLKKYGANSDSALASYGEIVGMVMPVLLFPNVLLICFSMLIIPEMSEAKIQGREKSITYMSKRILRFSLLFSLPVCGFFVAFGKQLGILVYQNENVGKYISIIAPIVPLLYLDKIVDGMLKGLNEQTHYLIYNMIDSSLRVILTFTLLPFIGIAGVVIVLYASAIVNSGLSIMRLIKVSSVVVELKNWLIKPTISTAFAGFISWCVVSYFKAGLILATLLFFFILTVFLMLLKTISKEEIFWIKSILAVTIKSVNKPKISLKPNK